MWKRLTPSDISIGTQRASRSKLSRLLTGAINVLILDFIILYPHFPITYSMNLPGLDRSGQVPTKPDYLTKSGGNVRAKCLEAWVWMVLILQFWTDEASIADGELFGGRMHPVSTLAEYVMSTINPVLPLGCKVLWDHVITRTLWMRKCLFNLTSEEE